VGDRPGLVEDLDLLGVGPNEVEDPVVRPHRVLEERSESGDGLAAPGRSVHEERAAPLSELRDLAEDRFLPRARPVRKEEGGFGRGRRGGRGRSPDAPSGRPGF